MAGRVHVCKESPPTFSSSWEEVEAIAAVQMSTFHLEAAMRINKTSNADFRLKVKILTSGVPQEG